MDGDFLLGVMLIQNVKRFMYKKKLYVVDCSSYRTMLARSGKEFDILYEPKWMALDSTYPQCHRITRR